MGDLDADVVVVGSGGAALVAAAVAAEGGADVAVLERSPVLGGTTAVSGGMLWVADNPLMREAGLEDSAEDALAYLDRVTLGEVGRERLDHLVATGRELVRWLQDETPVRLQPIDRPDYHADFPGARTAGRVLDNLPFATADHPGVDEIVRSGPHFPPLTYEERHRSRTPDDWDRDLIAERRQAGVRTLGGALAAGLVAAARDRGVEFVTGARVRELVTDGGRIRGVVAETGEGTLTCGAGRGVVLATGGYEWNEAFKGAFLRGPALNPATPPWNHGDGLVMAMKAGAALGNMSEAWWAPTFNVAGEEYDGRPMARHIIDELALPGSILVNRAGRRFVNEATNYNDLCKGFHVFDPSAYDYVNVPAWIVFDARFKRTYAVATVAPSAAAPDWFARGDSLAELAARIDVDAHGLEATVDRFNRDAAEGVDHDFHRGELALDLYYGDDDHEPNPCLAPLTEPPFFAVRILPGELGTKGGAVTDLDGRVLDHGGNAIEGLYAAGNVAASVMGPGYPGAGGSLGAAMTGAFSVGRMLG